MRGITKIIDELGLLIITKEMELKDKQEEIDELKKRIESIECYIDVLEGYKDARK